MSNNFSDKTDREQQETFKALVREGKGAEADALTKVEVPRTDAERNIMRLSDEIRESQK